MIPIIITLTHKIYSNGNIQVSPYHRWEHIYVRILQNLDGNRELPIYASTSLEYTKIVILSKTFDYVSIQKCIKALKKEIPSNLIINTEKEIIDNELACLANLYDERVQICENGSSLSKAELLDFRKKAYDWNAVQIENSISRERISVKKKRKISQSLISETRKEMMLKIEKELVIEKIENINGFVIFRFYDNDLGISKNIWKMAVTDLDAVDGYLLCKMRNHMALSFMIWPSWEEEFNCLQIFTFLRLKYVVFFYKMICEWFFKFMANRGIDERVINEVLSRCQVSVRDSDNRIKRLDVVSPHIYSDNIF